MDVKVIPNEGCSSIQQVIEVSPESAVLLAWGLVFAEFSKTAERFGLSAPESFVQAVRDMRDADLIDRVFANDLERLARMLKHAEAVRAGGRSIGRRDARLYAQLAVSAANRLHELQTAA